MVQKDESGKKVGTTTGAFSAHLKIDTWIESSDIRITFGHSRVEFSEVWNARLIDGQMHDGSIENEGAVGSTHATFRIKKMPGSWVGERKSAFGFMALGDLTELPRISCTAGKDFPHPPPPLPPMLPPYPPPNIQSQESGCFLGGGAVFTTAPDTDPTFGWMKDWVVTVTMRAWRADVQVLLDFYGKHLHEHALKVRRVDPDGVATIASTTPHSVMVKLMPSPVLTFTITASGSVEGLTTLECCCQAPPPGSPRPPPPPRPAYLAPDAPPPPPRPPRPPPPPGVVARTIVGRRAEPPPLPPPPAAPPGAGEAVTWTVVVAVLGMVGVAMFGCLKVAEMGWAPFVLQLRAAPPRLARRLLMRMGAKSRQTAAARPKGPKHVRLAADDDADAAEAVEAEAEALEAAAAGNRLQPTPKPAVNGARLKQALALDDNTPSGVALAPSAALGAYRGTPLLVDAAGVRLDLRLDLRGINSMGALQAAVAAAVGAASPGGLARLGALTMEYVPESGPARTVTQAVPFATIRAARELRLRSAARARPPPRVARSEVGTRSTGRGTGLD